MQKEEEERQPHTSVCTPIEGTTTQDRKKTGSNDKVIGKGEQKSKTSLMFVNVDPQERTQKVNLHSLLVLSCWCTQRTHGHY